MRPKSEITGQRPRQIVTKTKDAPGVSVRWTLAHHIKYLQLGGAAWVRTEVEKHMKKD